jgi:DHA1 family bicyclomycin/chloramphenicol resistance-like MFS transporter
MLDRFPVIRGTAASLQIAVTLAGSTLISGVLSPLVSHAPITMAASAAVISSVSFCLWLLYQRLSH